MDNLNLGRKMLLLTLLMNLVKGFVMFSCTILAAIFMVLFFKGNESSGVLIAKIMIATFIIVLKTVSIYKKVNASNNKVRLNFKLESFYLIDLFGIIFLFFFAYDHTVIYLVILGLWLLYAIIKGIISYRSLSSLNLDGLNIDEQFVNGLLNSSQGINNNVNYDDTLDLLEDESYDEDEEELDFTSVEDDHLVTEIYLYVLNKIGNRTGHDEEVILRELDPDLCCVFLIERLILEVTTNGFSQYFYISSGYFAFETIRCLEEIGASSVCSILKEALAFVYDGDSIETYKLKQLDRKLIENPSKQKYEVLDELNKRFSEEEEILHRKLIELIKDRN
ncbi:DMP19 family protein [Haloplasma contractile]|uniref:DNA mimic protein DMP19 C-terminal domain-containing protein n=1 Tax=Haloplasma contractile SSD-17B TaxID=1033810 RepID=F7Q1Z8_9MOLU|nr:DUF4375 domain-containing protein [Haloplasma contractile]ERJ12194.1 hypothetical protein HLPCO_001721 [Haloplasma contractile SSD-17B]